MKQRIESQREVNDLLQRKSHWSSTDVLRQVTRTGQNARVDETNPVIDWLC